MYHVSLLLQCQPICNMATLLAEGILAEKQGDGSMLRVIRTTIDTFTKCNIAQLAKIKGMIMVSYLFSVVCTA